MKSPGRVRYCQLPKVSTINGRSSSITNAFFNSIIPVVAPTDEEVLEALSILEIDKDDIRCAYCGDKATEWDHLRSVIEDQKPTGYITELANLVPACGKCNQSKGKYHWRKWMLGSARLSPTMRGIPDIQDRIFRLERYELWRTPTKIDFAAIVYPELWREHLENWRKVLALMRKSQELATRIRDVVAAAHDKREDPRLINSEVPQSSVRTAELMVQDR